LVPHCSTIKYNKMRSGLLSLLALGSSALALTFGETPTGVYRGEALDVTWTKDASDPEDFSLYLVASGDHYHDLEDSVSTDLGHLTVYIPDDVEAGAAYVFTTSFCNHQGFDMLTRGACSAYLQALNIRQRLNASSDNFLVY
jgi:hypothetical protein